ncbi:hypothetical protein HLRTI_000465 [Halorhabdus tiamatea SARL4B]|uniref:Uncharacterized protein n=1 Tax=Halorhabdus tiamatea SARL4B TaxID=1033806 RepID=U2E5D5_9EURY|nr:hypothetical protein HLRTI_000465 [Halorhabdus tiamatea SARL4B]
MFRKFVPLINLLGRVRWLKIFDRLTMPTGPLQEQNDKPE